MRVRDCLLFSSVLLCASCADPRADDADYEDQAVTEVSPPYPTWKVTEEPTTRLGSVEGTPESQFSQIIHAGVTSNGRLVVVDGGSREVRWFASDGSLVLRAGGAGEGPGQFSRIIAATVTPQDTVVLYDGRTQRLTWFGPDGALSRTRPMDLQGRVTLTPLADSRLLVAEERAVPNVGGAEYNATQDSLSLMLLDGDGPPQPLFERLGRQAVTWVRYVDGAPTATQQMELPFGNSTLVGVTDAHIAIVESGKEAVEFYNQSGVPTHLTRRTDASSSAVTTSMRESYLASTLEAARARGMPDHLARANAEALLELVPTDQRVAPFDRIRSDLTSGQVWVRDTRHAWDVGQLSQWTIYQSNGTVAARVATPSGLDVTQVSAAHVVGIERDELGVEHVAIYAIEGR